MSNLVRIQISFIRYTFFPFSVEVLRVLRQIKTFKVARLGWTYDDGEIKLIQQEIDGWESLKWLNVKFVLGAGSTCYLK